MHSTRYGRQRNLPSTYHAIGRRAFYTGVSNSDSAPPSRSKGWIHSVVASFTAAFTVAILAQGTSRAVAVTQAFCCLFLFVGFLFPLLLFMVSALKQSWQQHSMRSRSDGSAGNGILNSMCHRSHFGSRYKSGCCGHASLLSILMLSLLPFSLKAVFVSGANPAAGCTEPAMQKSRLKFAFLAKQSHKWRRLGDRSLTTAARNKS